MAQAVSNYEEKKIVVLSFKKDTEKSHGSVQYDSVRNLTPRSIILGGTSEKLEYLGENEIRSRWTVPLMGRGGSLQHTYTENTPLLKGVCHEIFDIDMKLIL